jgi:AraC-like DNA-binding protein
MMQLVLRPPPPLLRPFVESLWYFQGGAFPHAKERILPSGNVQLLVNLHEDELRSWHGEGYRRLKRLGGAALCGAFTHHFAIDTAEQEHILGVNFRPGGAAPFFALPIDALTEEHVELRDLWGRAGATLRERLLDQPTAAARLALLEKLLVERAVHPPVQPRALAVALQALDRGTPIAAVTTHLGLTPRRFIREFSEVVGLTPKRWQRVRRFQRVLMAAQEGADWAELALHCGYFDQAHLIHDFRAFSGTSPSRYRPRDGGRNHVPLQ